MKNRENESDIEREAKREQLAFQLSKEKTDELMLSYEVVVFSFPSDTPHPDYLELPMIDWKALLPWLETKGWDADFFRGSKEAEAGKLPVLFKKTMKQAE